MTARRMQRRRRTVHIETYTTIIAIYVLILMVHMPILEIHVLHGAVFACFMPT